VTLFVDVEPSTLTKHPEVVKLDLALWRTVTDLATVTVAGAVRAYAEASGAEVVAEDIETPGDLTRALLLGATPGQGWLWGRGEPQIGPTTFRPEPFAPRPIGTVLRSTPSEVVGLSRRFRRTPRRVLLPLSRTFATWSPRPHTV